MDTETVITEMERGESLLALCDKHNLKYHTIYKKVKEVRPELLNRSKSPAVRRRLSESKTVAVDLKKIKTLYFEENMTYSEISSLMGIAKGKISKLFKENCIQPKSMKDYNDRIWTEEKREEQRQKCYNGEIGVHSQKCNAYRYTEPERYFSAWCEENSIAFVRQYQISPGTHRYDFLLGDKLLVEIDGVYWHTRKEQIEKDRRFEKYASERGYTVLRFTDVEIRETSGECFNSVRSHLE